MTRGLLAGWILSGLLLGGLALSPGGQDRTPLPGVEADVARMGAPSNLERRQVLEAILTERGVPYTVETFAVEPRSADPRSEGANLVVTIGAGEEDIVLGAHYDAARLPDGALSLGAVDNAASAVILTRLAEAFQGERLRRRLRIVFFDMEEIGLVGSSRYLAAHAEDVIVAAINLDVNAYGDTIAFGATAGPESGALAGRVEQALVDAGVAVLSFPRFPASDHRSFQAAGIPALTVSTLPAGEARDLWSFLNGAEPVAPPEILRRIHSAQDTVDLVQPEAMALAYRAVQLLVRRLDQGD